MAHPTLGSGGQVPFSYSPCMKQIRWTSACTELARFLPLRNSHVFTAHGILWTCEIFCVPFWSKIRTFQQKWGFHYVWLTSSGHITDLANTRHASFSSDLRVRIAVIFPVETEAEHIPIAVFLAFFCTTFNPKPSHRTVCCCKSNQTLLWMGRSNRPHSSLILPLKTQPFTGRSSDKQQHLWKGADNCNNTICCFDLPPNHAISTFHSRVNCQKEKITGSFSTVSKFFNYVFFVTWFNFSSPSFIIESTPNTEQNRTRFLP